MGSGRNDPRAGSSGFRPLAAVGGLAEAGGVDRAVQPGVRPAVAAAAGAGDQRSQGGGYAATAPKVAVGFAHRGCSTWQLAGEFA